METSDLRDSKWSSFLPDLRSRTSSSCCFCFSAIHLQSSGNDFGTVPDI